MKRKTVIISIIAGIIIVGLCAQFAFGNRKVSETGNAVVDKSNISAELEEESAGEDAKSALSLKASSKRENMEEGKNGQAIEAGNSTDEQAGKESEEQEEIAVPEWIHFEEPIVELSGEQGELRWDWDFDSIQVDAETILLASDCYFQDRTLQQKIFFLAKTPEFELQEVFRQEDKDWDVDSPAEWLERRMPGLYTVKKGWVYEVDGILYLLDKGFQGAEPICDLVSLLGGLYSFSPDTPNTCDVTDDASRLIACTDEGLYEYDLETGEKTLLEPAFYAHREIVHVEGDCDCGVRDFEFDGPVEVQYAPDEQSFVYLTGTEEADWGDINGAVLCSREGEKLYQKNAEYIYGFRWIETEDKVYLAVFYGKNDSFWMDRVEVSTGEVETFETPHSISWESVFLNEDTCFGIGSVWEPDQGKAGDKERYFKIYHFSDQEEQEIKIKGEPNWIITVLNDGYQAYPLRYPQTPS